MRRIFAFVFAAGVLMFAHSGAAHAQSSYGYDSWYYNLPSGASYWYNSGYTGMYTDATTASYVQGSEASFRAIAPYGQPTTMFNAADPLDAARARAVAPPSAQPVVRQTATVVTQRRPSLIRRLFRGRR